MSCVQRRTYLGDVVDVKGSIQIVDYDALEKDDDRMCLYLAIVITIDILPLVP